MNIGIDIRSLMFGHYSGVGIYTYNILKNIFRIDKKNQYFLFYNSYKDVTETLPKFQRENVHLCPFQWPNKLLNLRMTFFNAPKIDLMVEEYVNASTLKTEYGKVVRQKLDLFFTPNWLFSSFSKSCKRILTVHDLSIFATPEHFSARQKLWHRSIKIRSLVENSHAIICVSENTLQDVKELLNVPEEKLHFIAEGVNKGYQPIKDKDRLLKIKKKCDLPAKYILTVCNIEPRKNVLGMIQAFEEYKKLSRDDDMFFVIVGDKGWHADYDRQVMRSIEKSKFADHMKIMGYVDPKDMPSLLNHATIFFLPTFYEGFGLPVLEAMACGKPVITSFTSSLPEITRDAALLVDPYNINDMTIALHTLAKNSALRSDLAKRGLKRRANYTWEVAAQKTLEIFETVSVTV